MVFNGLQYVDIKCNFLVENCVVYFYGKECWFYYYGDYGKFIIVF